MKSFRVIGTLLSLFILSIGLNAQTLIYPSIKGQGEPHIAVNPTNPKNLIAVTITGTDAPFKIGIYYSTNEGVSWTGNENAYGSASEGDPVIAFDPDGTAYMLYQVFSERIFYMRKSTDGGFTWDPALISSARAVHTLSDPEKLDRPWMSISKFRNAAGKFDIYISYTRTIYDEIVGTTQRPCLLKSADGGMTFSTLRLFTVPSGYGGQGAFVETGGANNELFFAWAEFESVHKSVEKIIIYRSTDGGNSFTNKKEVSVNQIGEVGAIMGVIKADSYPRLIADKSPWRRGVFMVWANQTVSSPMDKHSDIQMIKGTYDANGVFLWNANPVVVDGSAGEQWNPAITCSPDGVLAVSYYSSPGKDKYEIIYVKLKYSSDGGTVFSAPVNAGYSGGFLINTGENFLGDYFGIASSYGKAFPVFSQITANPSYNVRQIFSNTISIPEPAAPSGYYKVAIDQKDESGQSFEKFGLWNQSAFTNFAAPSKFIFQENSSQVVRAKQDFKSGSSQKYNNWDILDNPLNHNAFLIKSTTLKISSNFKSSQSGIVIKTRLEGVVDGGGSVAFADPWLIDYTEQPYGKRNQGTGAPLKTRTTPFYPNNTTSYSGDVYKGIFLNENPNFLDGVPGYKIQASDEQTINGRTAYFLNWSATGASFQNSSSLTTPMVFTSSNAIVTANYKGSFLSNNTNALAGNGQRKIVSQGNFIHCVYISMNAVWYTYSLNYGATWELMPEKLIYQAPAGSTITSLSMDACGNKAAIVYCVADEYSSMNYLCGIELGVVKSNENLYGPFTYYDMKPVVSMSNIHILVVYKPDANTGFQYVLKYNNANWNGTWKALAAVPNTTSASINPSLGINYYTGNIVHLVYQNGTASTSSIMYQKINIAGSAVAFSSLTNVSSGSGYSYNSSPSVTDIHYEPCIGWKAVHNMTLLENALLKYKIGSSWSGFNSYEAQDGEITSVNVNAIPVTSETFVMAWHEDAGGNNQFVKSDNLSDMLESNTNGKYVAVMAGDNYATAKIMSFNQTALPYYFNFSNPLSSLNKAGESTVSERILTASNESAVKFYGIGDIEVDGVKADFPNNRDSINIATKSILSEPFRLSEPSEITYKLNTGILRSDSASGFRDYEENMKFKLDIIDAAAGTPIAGLNEKTFHSFADTSDADINYYKVSGITNEGLVQLRISITNPGPDMQYNVINKYSRKSGLQKNFKEEIKIDNNIPTVYALSQNYPNPFNPSTIINYDIPEASMVTLKVYDVLGREITELVNEFKEAGRYNVTFDASHLSTGIYIYQLRANDYVSVKKMSFVK